MVNGTLMARRSACDFGRPYVSRGRAETTGGCACWTFNRNRRKGAFPRWVRYYLRASFGLTIHQANDPRFRFALFPGSAVNRNYKVRQQRRGLSPDGPMEIFKAIIVMGVNGACQGLPLRWIGCFDYRLDSVEQLVHDQ